MSEASADDARVDAVWEEFTDLSRGIGQDVTRISHDIGRVMEDVGADVRLGSTAGSRLNEYERAGYPGITNPPDGQAFCDALRVVVALRNRLEHDEWSVTYPHARQPDVVINGQGEEYRVTTNIETIRRLAVCAEACAEHLQQMSSRTAIAILFGPQAPPPQLDDVARQVTMEVQRMTSQSERTWRWEQLTHAEYYRRP